MIIRGPGGCWSTDPDEDDVLGWHRWTYRWSITTEDGLEVSGERTVAVAPGDGVAGRFTMNRLLAKWNGEPGSRWRYRLVGGPGMPRS